MLTLTRLICLNFSTHSGYTYLWGAVGHFGTGVQSTMIKKKTKTKKIHHSKQNDTQYTTDLNSTSTQKTQKMESIPLKESLVTGTESPGDTLGVYKYVTKQKNKE